MRPLRLRLLSVQFQLSFQRVPSSLRYAKFRLPSVFTIVQEAIQATIPRPPWQTQDCIEFGIKIL